MPVERPDFIALVIHEKVEAVAPIEGVSVGVRGDKLTWRVDFLRSATAAQRRDAQDVIDAFDIAAEDAILEATAVRGEKIEGTRLTDILIREGVISESDLG